MAPNLLTSRSHHPIQSIRLLLATRLPRDYRGNKLLPIRPVPLFPIRYDLPQLILKKYFERKSPASTIWFGADITASAPSADNRFGQRSAGDGQPPRMIIGPNFATNADRVRQAEPATTPGGLQGAERTTGASLFRRARRAGLRLPMRQGSSTRKEAWYWGRMAP